MSIAGHCFYKYVLQKAVNEFGLDVINNLKRPKHRRMQEFKPRTVRSRRKAAQNTQRVRAEAERVSPRSLRALRPRRRRTSYAPQCRQQVL